MPVRPIHEVRSNGPPKRARRSNRLPCNQANCRSVRMSTPDTREGEGGEERDCHLARPIAVWSNAPQRCNDGGLAGDTAEAGVGASVTTASAGKGAGPKVGALVAGHRRSLFSSIVLNAGVTRESSGPLVLGGPRLNRSQIHVFCGESAGMTRGSSIWHRLGRTLRRRASSIS